MRKRIQIKVRVRREVRLTSQVRRGLTFGPRYLGNEEPSLEERAASMVCSVHGEPAALVLGGDGQQIVTGCCDHHTGQVKQALGL